MILKAEEARNIVYNNHGDWETIEDGKQTMKEYPTNKLYRTYFSRGSTESQDTI